MRKLPNPDDVIGKLLSYKNTPFAEPIIGLCIKRHAISAVCYNQGAYILTLLVGEGSLWEVYENDETLRMIKT